MLEPRPLTVLAFVALAQLGCAGFHIAGFGTPPAPTLSAMNPLGGRPLTSKVRPADSDLQIMRGENCTVWPVSDQYIVEADDQQICVNARRYILSYEDGPGLVEVMNVTVSTDDRPSVPMQLGMNGQGARKIGRCYQGYAAENHRTGLWEVEYGGCRRNDFLTRSTSHVTLNRRGGWGNESELVRWTLVDAQPAAAPVAVAATARAPEPAAATSPPPLISVNASPAPRSSSPQDPGGKCYVDGLPLLSQQRYTEALATFSRCVQLSPRMAEGYAARGNALMGLQRYAEAVLDYEYALQVRPQLVGTLYALGEANQRLGRREQAKACYQRFAAEPLADPKLRQVALANYAALR